MVRTGGGAHGVPGYRLPDVPANSVGVSAMNGELRMASTALSANGCGPWHSGALNSTRTWPTPTGAIPDDQAAGAGPCPVRPRPGLRHLRRAIYDSGSISR
jgi:hypothetical protein